MQCYDKNNGAYVHSKGKIIEKDIETGLACRFCSTEIKTHILQNYLHLENRTITIEYQDLFNKGISRLKQIAKKNHQNRGDDEKNPV